MLNRSDFESPARPPETQNAQNGRQINSLLKDSSNIPDLDENETIPSDPLDLVDFNVRQTAMKEGEGAHIRPAVVEFCK